MPIANRTDMYRMKALACEQQASDASDPTSKQDWEELAIEWRTMANPAARMNGGQLEVERNADRLGDVTSQHDHPRSTSADTFTQNDIDRRRLRAARPRS
jgi:hypothetical protein